MADWSSCRTNMNFTISLRAIPRKIKILGIPFRSIPQQRKTLGISFEPLRERKSFGILDGVCMMLFICEMKSLFFYFMLSIMSNLIFSRNSFRSIPSLGMGYSETHGILRNEFFVQENNENSFESIPRNIFGTEFQWLPFPKYLQNLLYTDIIHVNNDTLASLFLLGRVCFS